MNVKITVDDRLVRDALKNVPDEVNRALRNALNDTAREGQRVAQDLIAREFDVRQKAFVLNTVKIEKSDRATKEKLEATVRIDPNRDLLAKFEEGEQKTTIGGGKYLAVPVRDIRTKGGHVLPRFAFKKFQPFALASSLTSVRLRGMQRVRDRQPRLVGQGGSFFVRLRDGRPALAISKGKRGFRILYFFHPTQRVDTRLHFVENVGAAMESAWPANAEDAVGHALKRAGLT